ncbi:MAG: hypothetical protein JO044_16880 [Mycobacteriaceae bacterium]|nr:hypothetical protein [Mycobacteriaceae bacterium]
MSSKWTAADVLDQSGRVAVITGSNGPDGIGEQRGHPKVVLWTVSEELTGVTYPV